VTQSGAAVVCTGLTYRFGDHVAVDHVDLKIRSGETFGLPGPQRAGKPPVWIVAFLGLGLAQR
jgi:ABC-type branched-subunit amino acid transport system ATPase component